MQQNDSAQFLMAVDTPSPTRILTFNFSNLGVNAEITVGVVFQGLEAGVLVVVRVFAPGTAESDHRGVAQQLGLECFAAVFAFALVQF